MSEVLARAGIRHTVCVATEYGEMVLKPHPLVKVQTGRMNREAMADFFRAGQFAAVADATHPYADVVTENIKAAAAMEGVPYLRLKREEGRSGDGGAGIQYFKSHEDCARALEQVQGNVLLTTGSKNLAEYCSRETLKERLYVRVLPGVESIKLCMEQGICGRQILALQGPFSEELNEAILRQYRIQCIVTKKSGAAGGYGEKVEAARRVGAQCFVVLPDENLEAGEAQRTAGTSTAADGLHFAELCKRLETICGQEIPLNNHLEIILAGIGMGHESGLTGQVRDAIRDADVLLGAERMIAPYQPRLEKRAYYRTDQILPYLKQLQEKEIPENRRVVVLFSGDTGFYSGCQKLFWALQEEIKADRLKASLSIMPGTSSVSYLASCIGESYQDAAILSIHGKVVENLAEQLAGNRKTFLLTSGASDVRRLGEILLQAGMSDCQVIAGYQLSYPEQRILYLTPKECLAVEGEGLYTCMIMNPAADCDKEQKMTPAREPEYLVHGMPDGEFIREKVPMTKEEVREVSICKLKLKDHAVVYDVGSGTGSIAVEIARLSDSVQVYALERKPEAVSLIHKNKEKFGLSNITVIETEVPQGLEELPAPTHAFIGGSGGQMKEILAALYEKNPAMRVVINAITMETICEIRQALAVFPVAGDEVVQMQVSRAKKAGPYHLMQAENPVWICSFDFVPKGE